MGSESIRENEMRGMNEHATCINAMIDAIKEQRNLDAKLLELSADQIRLMCGEMSAEAMRCVKAVLVNRAAAIRNL